MSDTHFADEDAVRELAQNLTPQMIQCRDFGHNWKPYTATPLQGGGFTRTLRCACEAERVQELNSRGAVVSSHYNYPEGYQMPKGFGRISAEDKGVFRLESIYNQIGRPKTPAKKRSTSKRNLKAVS